MTGFWTAPYSWTLSRANLPMRFASQLKDSMKYVYAFTMLLSLVATTMCSMLGMSYIEEGYGLHPALASSLAFFCVCAGFYAATMLSEIEHHDY